MGWEEIGLVWISDLEEMLEQSDVCCVSCFVVWKLQRIIWHSIFVLTKMCVLKKGSELQLLLTQHASF